MEHYFETYEENLTTAHDTLDEAIKYAEAHNIEIICEIGGSWGEYKKCEFCGEWDLLYEIDKNNGICDYCRMALWSRGEKW